MQGYRRILIATDFSDISVAAAQRGAELAHRYEAGLMLLHVIEHFPEDMPSEWIAPENRDPATYYREQARAALADLARSIGHAEAAQEVVMSSSSARYEILRFAETADVDLIVIGWHGGGALPAFGSTAMGVISDAPCDVVVVRSAS